MAWAMTNWYQSNRSPAMAESNSWIWRKVDSLPDSISDFRGSLMHNPSGVSSWDPWSYGFPEPNPPPPYPPPPISPSSGYGADYGGYRDSPPPPISPPSGYRADYWGYGDPSPTSQVSSSILPPPITGDPPPNPSMSSFYQDSDYRHHGRDSSSDSEEKLRVDLRELADELRRRREKIEAEQLRADLKEIADDLRKRREKFEAEIIAPNQEMEFGALAESLTTLSQGFLEGSVVGNGAPYSDVSREKTEELLVFQQEIKAPGHELEEDPEVPQSKFELSKVFSNTPSSLEVALVAVASKRMGESIKDSIKVKMDDSSWNAYNLLDEMPNRGINVMGHGSWNFDPGGVDSIALMSRNVAEMTQIGKMICVCGEALSVVVGMHRVLAKVLIFGYSSTAFQGCKELIRDPECLGVEGPNSCNGDRFIYCHTGCPMLIPFDRGRDGIGVLNVQLGIDIHDEFCYFHESLGQGLVLLFFVKFCSWLELKRQSLKLLPYDRGKVTLLPGCWYSCSGWLLVLDTGGFWPLLVRSDCRCCDRSSCFADFILTHNASGCYMMDEMDDMGYRARLCDVVHQAFDVG